MDYIPDSLSEYTINLIALSKLFWILKVIVKEVFSEVIPLNFCNVTVVPQIVQAVRPQ